METTCDQRAVVWEPSPVTSKIAARRLILAGHCIRHPEEIASQLVLWEPQHGHANRVGKTVSYIDLLKLDTGIESTEDLRCAMIDRDACKAFVKDARSRGRLNPSNMHQGQTSMAQSMNMGHMWVLEVKIGLK